MFAICADVHIHAHTQCSRILESGENSRLVDGVAAFLWVVEQAHKAGAAAVIVAGDLWHDRRAIQVPALELVSRAVRGAAKTIPLILLTGNHDLHSAGTGRSALSIFDDCATIITDVTTKKVGGIDVTFIPWTDDPETVSAAVSTAPDGSVVVGHLGISGGKSGPSSFEIPGGIPLSALKGKQKFTFLGHYHKHQKVTEDVIYVGSTLQLAWGERNDGPKGFVMVDRGGKAKELRWRFVENNGSPQFIELSDPKKAFSSRREDFVRILAHSKAELDAAQKLLGDRDGWWSVVLESDPDEVKPRMATNGMSDEGVVRRYVELNPPTESDPEDVVRAGMKYLSDVEA